MKNEETIAKVATGAIDEARLREVLNSPRSSALPFHEITGKLLSQERAPGNKYFSTFSTLALSPRTSQQNATNHADFGQNYADVLASTNNSHSTISVQD
jgi:hypothetical protein